MILYFCSFRSKTFCSFAKRTASFFCLARFSRCPCCGRCRGRCRGRCPVDWIGQGCGGPWCMGKAMNPAFLKTVFTMCFDFFGVFKKELVQCNISPTPTNNWIKCNMRPFVLRVHKNDMCHAYGYPCTCNVWACSTGTVRVHMCTTPLFAVVTVWSVQKCWNYFF